MNNKVGVIQYILEADTEQSYARYVLQLSGTFTYQEMSCTKGKAILNPSHN